MAPSESRPAFRLPWQSGQASELGSEMASQTATVDVPAWPSHDLVRRDHRTDAIATASGATDTASPTPAAPEATGTATTEWAPGANTDGTPAAEVTTTETTGEMAAVETTAGTTPEGSTSTTHAPTDMPVDLRGRKPTKFLADLTRAMRQAADEARQGALAQFQADVTRHIESARANADTAAGEARRRADDDVASLREWSKTEIARIKQETEDGTAARRTQLEAELAAQTTRLEHEVERVQERVRAFEAEMETFFQRLGQEDDPSAFAGVAEQLPEPPAFEAWDALTDEPAADDMTTGEAGPINADASDETGQHEGEPVAATMAAETTDAATPADPWTTSGEGTMPPMRPDDFAAAEAEAATWQTDEPVDPPASTSDTDHNVDTDAGAAWPPVVASDPLTPATTRTQVVLVGLVSVASIATFKRLLSRVHGVRTVQVASGPDGEFLFKTLHSDDLDIAAAVAGIPGFDVQVLESSDGVVNARAVDPEVV